MASAPAPLPTDVYGQLPNIELMRLSPSGDRLAYVVIAGDKRALLVKTLAGTLLFNTPVGDSKIRDLDWAGEDHLLLTISATRPVFTGRYELDQTISLNLTTQKGFYVFGTVSSVLHATYGYWGSVQRNGHWFGYFGGETLSKTLGFDPTFDENSLVELYQVDLDSGISEVAAPARQNPSAWAVDANGAVLAHSEYVQKTGEWSLRRGLVGGDPLATLNHPYGEIYLEGLGRAPGTVVVAKATPEEWSLADGSHAALPVDGLVENYYFDPTTRRLVGVILDGDRPEQQFFEPKLKARQAAFRKALKLMPWIQSWSADFNRMTLFTVGDGDAGTYWLFDGKALKPYGYSYPGIPDANVGRVSVVTYKAADGLELHGILTLPPGRDAKSLPVVVLPHGGPQAHDAVWFDWWAQAFAGHGYAVFQPNFRGSDGYGLEFRDAGFGQWGRKMQSDISDGMAALAAQGIVDPKRACIVGASYGGYAALAGVTLQHGLYRCAVSYGGISDLDYFLNTEAPDTENAASRYLRQFLGVKTNSDAALRELSPARFADRADAPILLIHGADDTVVPIGQSREMERVLRKAGKPVEFVLLKSEDHWLSRDATRKAMLAASVAFVEKNNPAD